MVYSQRKTGFIGFLVGISSIKKAFHELVCKDGAQMNYLLTYKWSQDHLELFFCAIRASGGFNNNPNAMQFIAHFKKLLMVGHSGSDRGNCIAQDPTALLDLFTDTCRVGDVVLDINTAATIRKYDLDFRLPDQTDHDYVDSPNVALLSTMQKEAVPYIAGFCGKMTAKGLQCITCSDSLGSRTADTSSSFLSFKDRGGLFKPTQSVVSICEMTEVKILRLLKTTQGEPPKGTFVFKAVFYKTLTLPIWRALLLTFIATVAIRNQLGGEGWSLFVYYIQHAQLLGTFLFLKKLDIFNCKRVKFTHKITQIFEFVSYAFCPPPRLRTK